MDYENLPIISGRQKLWRCKNGHEYRSEMPYPFTLPQVPIAAKICPICVIEYFGENFGTEEVDEDAEDEDSSLVGGS